MKLKYWLRSRSLSFGINKTNTLQNIATYQYNNQPIHYRSGTSDMVLIYEILLKKKFNAEYYVSSNLNPKVIIDVGSNIGITAIFFAKLFPNAQIYCFEPLSLNYELLQVNTQNYPNIHCFDVGLGKADGEFDISISADDATNFGGASLVHNNASQDKSFKCYIKNINTFFAKLNISQIDLLKIDTEGSEYEIITHLQKQLLQHCQWIIGELHGNKDYELLSYLHELGFKMGMKKTINNDIFIFHALKPMMIKQLSRTEQKYLIQ